MRVCSTPACPELVPRGQSRCDNCNNQADRNRGTAHQRGYTSKGHRRFRHQVLARHPICVLCKQAPATVADHHPVSRKELIRQGANPNDPAHGRGLCKTCHDTETAANQPGGWHT